MCSLLFTTIVLFTVNYNDLNYSAVRCSLLLEKICNKKKKTVRKNVDSDDTIHCVLSVEPENL